MASAKTLNARNLETLGAPRLAELLIEISTGNATAKRRLRLELAGTAGADEAAHEIGKRLASIAKSRTFIDWQKAKTLVTDLETQHRAILDHVAPGDPRAALGLLWRFMHCANSVLARSNDSNGRIAEIFRTACRDLAPLAEAAKIAPAALAESVFEALRENDHDQYDALIGILAPQLGVAGLEQLRALTLAWRSEPIVTPPRAERVSIGYGTSGPIYADQIEARHRRQTAERVLQQISDALGDVDGFIASFEGDARKAPIVAAAITTRLLQAGRPEEAWIAIESARAEGMRGLALEWEQARIATLETLGRADEAQAFRWHIFSTMLDPDHLRAYLRKLPEFEDFDAEQRAIAHALAFPDAALAIAFLVRWPALDQASRLVINRIAEISGEAFELLAPAADALEAKYPLAATLLRRAMIDFALGYARSSRYRHAARHLVECETIAPRIVDFGGAPDHEAYLDGLRAAHARKRAFWNEVDAL